MFYSVAGLALIFFFETRRRKGSLLVVWLGGVDSFASSAPAALIASRDS